ncbi:MAG: sugar phosphate isomerase/epimerase [Sphingobacteriales bacterium]|nr:sugar phosphate isomerase/epimerase [Sphingobacteriales bacterium]
MNNSRRSFIKQIGLATAGAIVLPNTGSVAMEQNKKFGIQLYSLRDEIPKGVENVIAQISKAGYSYIEGFGFSDKNGYFGLSSEKFKDLLDKYSLTSPSAHFDFGGWEKSQDDHILKSYIASAKILKQDYVTIPYINPEIFKSVETTKAFTQKVNRASKIVKDEGLKLAYHNHNIEFFDLNGTTGYDILLQETDPDLVDFEMDLYWVVRANKDPLTYFKEHKGRFTMWHVKDMRKSDKTLNTEVGNGLIDFKPIFKQARLAGLKYPLVEQENFEINPFESIQRSAVVMNKMSI